MKKSALFVLCFVLLLPCLIIFGGCGEKKKPVLEIVKPIQTVYILNENLNTEGGEFVYRYEGKEYIGKIQKEMIKSGFESRNPGTRKMIFEYKNHKLEVEYTVLNLQKTNFVATKIFENNEEVEISEEEKIPYVFGRDMLAIIGEGESQKIGTFSISENGDIKIVYKKIAEASSSKADDVETEGKESEKVEKQPQEIVMLDFERMSGLKYRAKTLVGGKRVIIEAK